MLYYFRKKRRESAKTKPNCVFLCLDEAIYDVDRLGREKKLREDAI